MEHMQEKRSLPRQKTGVFFGVYDRATSRYVGRLVDLNTNGLMLIGKRPFKVGETFKLKMDLPQEINGKSQIEFDANVKWSEKSKNTNLFSAGLAFIEIEPAYTQLIDELIKNPMYNDPAAALPLSISFDTKR
jgi:hypothetical protein